jgi:hypothetical protein
MTNWDVFDTKAYFSDNYQHAMLPEDEDIMRFAVAELRRLGVATGGLRSAADVGTGPNLYPALLLSPYLADDATLDLIDPAPGNRAYLTETLGSTDLADSPAWSRFERYLRRLGHEASLRRVQSRAEVTAGSVFDLPAHRYDAVTSFFVCESITDSLDVFTAAIGRLVGSVKPGGLVVAAHMVGSQGWPAGTLPLYPAVDLSYLEIQRTYADHGTFRTFLTTHQDRESLRPGYDGMAVVVGTTTPA